jgi:hypothetical protein
MARRPWRTARLPELVSTEEACSIIGVSRTQLYRWMKPDSGTYGPKKTYMVPPAAGTGPHTGLPPIWTREDVERFAIQDGRRRAPASGD